MIQRLDTRVPIASAEHYFRKKINQIQQQIGSSESFEVTICMSTRFNKSARLNASNVTFY